jgi:hypothetical protein
MKNERCLIEVPKNITEDTAEPVMIRIPTRTIGLRVTSCFTKIIDGIDAEHVYFHNSPGTLTHWLANRFTHLSTVFPMCVEIVPSSQSTMGYLEIARKLNRILSGNHVESSIKYI